MAEEFKGTLWKKAPPRDVDRKGGENWLEIRKKEEGAEGLWRIHNKLYDLSSYIKIHPGGSEWLELTKGTDITEAFEAHHISPMPSRMLKRFEVREAKTERLPPYTFKPGGFYATLRGRVYGVLPEPEMRGISIQTRILADTVVFFLITFSILTSAYQNLYLAAISGAFLAMITVAAHNFFHLRENWRRFYFDLSMMSSTDWRISHALSHHLYPNSLYDLEVTMFEPYFIQWLPHKKSMVVRIAPCAISLIVYTFMFPAEIVRRLNARGFRKNDLIPFLLPLIMLRFAPEGHIVSTLLLWLSIVMFGSLFFGIVGVNAAHHHPDIFHDGDTPRDDADWGLAVLDTVRDRPSVSGVKGSLDEDKNGLIQLHIDSSGSQKLLSFILVMFNFGHHTLHHLFPTVDHWHLPKLYPVLEQTMNEFGIPFSTLSFTGLLLGQLRQGSKTVPNPLPPKSFKKIAQKERVD